MTPQEFAAKIKTKYPQYQNVDDLELAKKVVEKYPEYANQVKFTEQSASQPLQKESRLSDDVSRFDPSKTKKLSDFLGTTKLGQGIGMAISNAIGTQDEAADSVDDLIGTQSQLLKQIKKAKAEGRDTTRLQEALNNLSDEIKGAGNFVENVGTGGLTNKEIIGSGIRTATTIASAGLGSAPTIAGKAAQFGTLGAIGGAGSALEGNKSTADTIKDTAVGAAVGVTTGAAFGLAGKGFKALGNFLGKTGDKIQTSVIKPSQADIKDGFSIETIKKFDLGGSLKQSFSKTDSKLDELSKQLNAKLAQSNTSVDLNRVYENTAKRLLGGKLENFGSNSQMEGAIEKLRNEITQVAGNNGIVSVPEAQTVKRAAGHFGAWVHGVTDPESTASQRVYNTFYNELKQEIEKSSPAGVREINKQISELIPVMNALIRRIPVAERNNALSLTDIITLAGAAIEPRALSLSLLNLASKSGTVGRVLSKFGPQAGEKASRTVQAVEPVGRVISSR